MEVIAFISFFLGASWDFFTEINVPGFDFSFATLFVGLFLATLGLRFVMMMIGVTATTEDIRFLGKLRGTQETRMTVRDKK